MRGYLDVDALYTTIHVEELSQRLLEAAFNLAMALAGQKRLAEARALLSETTPAARRVFGESHELTLKMRWNYATLLYIDRRATLDDLHKAVTTLEEMKRTARRVFGGQHPTTTGIEGDLRNARAALRARETPSPPPPPPES